MDTVGRGESVDAPPNHSRMGIVINAQKQKRIHALF